MPTKTSKNSRTADVPAQPGDRMKKTPQRVVRWVCMDADAAGRVEELEFQEENLSKRLAQEPHLRDRYDSVVAELDEAREEAREHAVKFVAISIGSKPWQKLLDQYPPSREQKREVAKEAGNMHLSFNPDTFPRVAVKNCLRISQGKDANGIEILDELTDEEIADMYDGDEWNAGETSELFGACVLANQRVSRVGDLGNE
jgi:hypothetical protein